MCVNLSYRATVACEYQRKNRACTEVAEFTDTNPVGTTQELFGGNAVRHFREMGWQCCEPGKPVLCPHHAAVMMPIRPS